MHNDRNRNSWTYRFENKRTGLASRTCPNKNNVCDVFVLWQHGTIDRSPRNVERTRQLLRESRRRIEHPDAVEDHSGLKRRSDCVCCSLRHETLMLGVIDNPSFIDQHDRDIASDFVPALQSRVVQKILVGEIQQWSLVLRTSKNFEQLRIK
jgi:hypothetical protein